MSDRRPAIIVSLPAATVAEVRRLLPIAAEGGGDLAEVRFDRWTLEELARAREIFPAPLPLVATLRSRAEGGAGPDDPVERAPLLERLAALPFRWIDLEAGRDDEAGLRLPPSESLGRIVSTHRTSAVPPGDWSRWVREVPPRGSVRKVVVHASVGEALSELLPQLPPPGENAIVALTTGPSGPILRALSARLGFPLVFAALPAESAGAPPPVEPSQIPVDHLRPFLSARDSPPLFALAGHPVAHSRSPSLHARWMRRTQRTGLYVALDFATDEEFVTALPVLGSWGFRGLNVTHPFKEVALGAATEVRPAARACGVANCLTLRDDEVEAENTDLAAILRRLEELKRSGRWDGAGLAVLGAGGAARATLAAANALGARAQVYGRRRERARALASEFGAEAPPIESARPAQLVIHATDVGRAGTSELELPLDPLLDRSSHVVDWVYAPDVPTVRIAAEHAGATYEDGRRLLVYQASVSFGIWWGDEPEPEEIARTLEEEGCAA